MPADEPTTELPAEPTVGFLGCGQMATALGTGLVNSGFVPADRLCGSDPSEAGRAKFAEATGANTFADNAELAAAADVLVIAVKPQVLPAVLRDLAPAVRGDTLFVSIAAGVPIARLADLLGEGRRVARVMPNTPALVGRGAAGYSPGPRCTAADAAFVGRMLGTVGLACEVPEDQLHAVTAVSGSGPAYGYLFAEALADGGVRAGLPRPVAARLAAQTLLGAAAMVLETGRHPGELKDAVCSPAGTTIAAVHALERGGFRAAVMDAVAAAAARSRELA